ncbi:NUDIX hydrolase [Paenibacillus thermotolerans]|uniref:NUDIX hydrolase n=1 Tax=Paenibacillus thermotolerans TaxID=3027807 RepID=UPI0023678196|nr:MULTISPECIES: NUDIX hydrolase [unclassified Paenibacillus]
MNQNHTDNRNEPTIGTKQVFKGRIISLQVDEVLLPGGATSTREIIKHPGAVAVIALVDGKLLTVEQYRKPLEKFQVEIPAGKLDAGEDPAEAARRELREETGYTCETMTLLHSVPTSPGFADEIVHIYVADGLTPGEAQPDEDEYLSAEALSMADAERYIAEGRISDAKTIIAYYAWRLFEATGTWGIPQQTTK